MAALEPPDDLVTPPDDLIQSGEVAPPSDLITPPDDLVSAPEPTAATHPGHLMGFDTPLTPEEEQAFQGWKQQYAPKDSGFDYDLRGAFKAGVTPDPKTGHWPDTFKKPNEPTFSDQSQYAKVRPDLAGHWTGAAGDQYVPPAHPGIAAGIPAELQSMPGFGPAARAQSAFGPAAAAALTAATGVPAPSPDTPAPVIPPSVDYIARSAASGVHSLFGAGARVLGDVYGQLFGLTVEEAEALHKADPTFSASDYASGYSPNALLERAATSEQDASTKIMEGASPEAKARYGKLTYGTLDPKKAAWASPTRVVGDILQSLPSTLAMGVTARFGGGAAERAFTTAIKDGATQEVARKAAIDAAAKVITRAGAASEGTIGYAQQALQTEQQVQSLPDDVLAKSPEYQELLREGYDKAAARKIIATRAGNLAGFVAGAVDAGTNLASGPVLGRIIGEGGNLPARVAKGFATEGTQESAQGFGEQLGQNLAVKQHADPSQNPWEGVLENVLQGGLVGGITGGFTTGAMGRGHEQEATEEAPSPEAPPPVAETTEAPKGGPGAPPAAPPLDLGEGEILNLRDPKGGQPKQVTVLGQSKDGKITTVEFEDGTTRDLPTPFVEQNVIPFVPPARPAPPPAPPPAPKQTPPRPAAAAPEEGQPVGEDERFNIPDDLIDPETGQPPVREPGEDLEPHEPWRTNPGKIAAEHEAEVSSIEAEAAANVRAGLPPTKVEEPAPQAVAPKLFLSIGNRRYPVDSLQDASEKFRATVDEMGIGASQTPQAFVQDGSGKHIGYVAYNGRVFPGTPQEWKSGVKPLYDPIQPETPAEKPEGTKASPVRAPETDADLQPARDQTAAPTPDQAKAENYKKGHIANLHGMDITIETPKGATRAHPEGHWSNVNNMGDYGYIKSTVGADKDHLDVYIGPNPKSEKAYVVDQIDPKTGAFDEHKGILGADSPEQAAAIYDDGFSDGSGPSRRRDIKEMPVSEFRDWVKSPATKKAIAPQPVGENVTGQTKPIAAPTTRPLDDNKKPIFHKGERVVINEDGPYKGRHGVISEATGITMRPIFGGNSSTSYHYTVKTDQGTEMHVSNLAEETEKPGTVIPDPVVDGVSMTPETLRSSIGYARKNAADAHARAGRARMKKMRDNHLESAKISEAKAAKYQAALDAWMKKNPEAAAQHFPAGPAVPTTDVRTAVPQPPSTKATYKENEGKDGIEVTFSAKPDDATIGRLKAVGFRWSGRQKLWYARRTPKTIGLAKELAGEKPTPAAAPVTVTPITAAPTGPRVMVNYVGADGLTEPERAAAREKFTQLMNLHGKAKAPDGTEYSIKSHINGSHGTAYTVVRGIGSAAKERAGEFPGWGKDQAIAEALNEAFPSKPSKSPAPTNKPTGEWTQIGVNANGHPIFEDSRGVRSYTERGIRITEPVGFIPSREGPKISVERPAGRDFEPVTPTERVETQAAEEGGRAELDDDLYQPGGMPVTSAIPPEAVLALFKRGDTVSLKPGLTNSDRLSGRTIVDVSPDGKFITLDGGLRVTEDQIDQITDLALQPEGETPTLSPEEGTNGLPVPVSQRPAGQRPEAVPGTGADETNRPASQGQDSGGVHAPRPTPVLGTQGGGRPSQRPAGPTAGGGAGNGANAGIPRPGEGPEPGTAGRPPDAEVQGTDYRITPGEIGEDRGPKAKAHDNIKAIELVKRLKAEDRPATREEQGSLARYVGWGGQEVSGAFPNSHGKYGNGYEGIGKRLKELLTPEEYATASRSTQYAHYTAEHVIRSMWDAVSRMGFEGGNVFEPGMGIGHFLGMMPGDIAEKSQYQGVEMDHLTADIARFLYPESGVRQADFTQMPLPDNTFDLVIGNPPFSSTIIKADPKYAARKFELHDYFFAKSMDALRPGGIMAFVTSAGTMNKIDNSARLYMAQRGEFLGGVRLPSIAFYNNARTKVTTDILFFKKRDEPISVVDAGGESWVGTTNRVLPDDKGVTEAVSVNNYFTEHPEMILGEEGRYDELYFGRYGIRALPGADLRTDLAKALQALPEGIYQSRATPTENAEADFAAPETKDGSYYLKDGRLMQYENGVGKVVQGRGKGVKGGVTTADREKVLGLIPIRDALRDVFKADLAENVEDAALSRDRLNKAYDAFVAKFGPINKAEFEYRRPTIVQQEVARAEEREAAIARGELWNEGDFDARDMLGDILSEDIEEDEDEETAKRTKKLSDDEEKVRRDLLAHKDELNDEQLARLAELNRRYKGPTWAQIARARHTARLKQNNEGTRPFREGSFDPEAMKDVVIDKRPNIKPFMDDPESYRLRSIEEYNEHTGEAKKRRIFHESVLTKENEPDIRSAQDGVLWSLNKFGRLNLEKIAEKRGQTKEALLAELGDSVYQIPGTTGTYQMADEYLSGDILDKLAEAKRYGETDDTFARNIAALEAAKPAPLPPAEVRMSFGMPWIPSEVLEEFAREHMGISNDIYIRHSPTLGGWTVRVGNQGPQWARWSTEDYSASALMQEALNRTKPRVYRWEGSGPDRRQVFDPIGTQAVSDRIDEISNEFAAYDRSGNLIGGWVLDNPEKMEALAQIYNNTLNRTVLRQFDGAYLTTPGISAEWKWRPHQRRVVARIILSGNTYVAHAVGGGKTSEYIGAGMEMKRLGLINKPMYAVPNIMLAQFTKEFYEQYPNARIMVADERRFHTSRRKQFMANVAQEDLDAVIITHSSFGMLPLSRESQSAMIQEEIDKIDESLGGLDKQQDRVTIKKLENQKEKLEQRLRGAFNSKKDKTMTFEEMGVDFLFVDEAHLFRKLDFASRQSIKGIDGTGSNRAFDLYAKIRYLESKRPGRSVVMGSGTPITNTMGELYTLSKYMQREALEKRGIGHFDSWAASFGETHTSTEPTPQGTYERVTRFARFVNSYELYKMVGEVMDIVTPHQLEQYVVRPKVKGGKREYHLAPKTHAYEAFQQRLVDRVNAIKARRGPPKKGDDILLSVINDGRHAAIDMRFVERSQDDPESKLNMALSNVVSVYHRTTDHKFFDPATNYQKQIAQGPATQMIFSNLGVNGRGPMGFSGYDWIIERLRREGIPRNEIAVIGDYKSHVARQKLFNDMNAGKVRILIGSTQKMGMGVNAQRRLYAVHNLDPLWFPADDEQRIGRILRQGNWNHEIEIHDYATKGTYDEQMWKLMGNKARFVEQFFRGDPTLRTMEDLGEASFYEQASAIAASDERIIKLTELQHDQERLERQSAAHAREQYSLESKLRYAKEEVAAADKNIPMFLTDIAQRVPVDGENFRMTVGDKEYDTREDAAKAFGRQIEETLKDMEQGERRVVGEIGGFPVLVAPYGKEDLTLFVRRSNRTNDAVNTQARTPGGMIGAIISHINSFEDRIRYYERTKQRALQEIASIEPQIGKPFTKGAEITNLRNEIRTLERQIAPMTHGAEMPPQPPTIKTGLTPEEEQNRRDLLDHYDDLDSGLKRRLLDLNWRAKNANPLDTIESVTKAIEENASLYHESKVDHDDFDARAKALHDIRAKLAAQGPSDEPQYSRIERDQTDTPEFKRWFGDSKVVDKDGKPLVVYHGTTRDFPEFGGDRAYFTSDQNYANRYAEDEGGNLKPVYLNISNPLDLYGIGKGKISASSFEDKLRAAGITSIRNLTSSKPIPVWAWMQQKAVRDAIKDAGYDGVIQHESDVFDTAEAKVFVTFSPKQIKSAIGNRGTFDPNDPNIQYSRIVPEAEPAPTFFSGLERAVEGIPQEKAGVNQWRATIKNLPGVKKDELDWLGLDQWLAPQSGTLTKDQILGFIRDNNIEIKEVMKGEGPKETAGVNNHQAQARFAELNEKYQRVGRENMKPSEITLMGWLADSPNASDLEYLTREYDLWLDENHLPAGSADDIRADLQAEAEGADETTKRTVYAPRIAWLHDFTRRWDEAEAAQQAPAGWSHAEGRSGTRYATYTLPGGENYRELLLTLPVKIGETNALTFDQISKLLGYGGWTSSLTPSQKTEIEAVYERQKMTPPEAYQRLEDIKKEKSQLALDRDPVTNQMRDEAKFHELSREAENLTADMKTPQGVSFKSSHWDEPNILAHIRFNDRTDADGKRTLFLEEIQDDWAQGIRKRAMSMASRAGLTGEAFDKRVAELIRNPRLIDLPKHPFQTTWQELAFKRMLRYAAENGYDQIAWTTGDIQAERYDLSKSVDHVSWARRHDGTYDLTIDLGPNHAAIMRDKQTVDQISDLLGKDVADKIAKGENSEKSPAAEYSVMGRLQDDDLKVGGEGMKGFYDKMLPAFANKYGKKWDAKVGETNIQQQPSVAEVYKGSGWHLVDGIGNPVGRDVYRTKEDALRAVKELPPTKGPAVHSLPITPSMRESVMQGQPMFMRIPWGKKEDEVAPPEAPKPTEETVGIGADLRRMHKIFGGKMYGAAMPSVTMKELLQNSFDAVKSAVKRGDIKPGEGNIDIMVDQVQRVIQFRDNGAGMTPETVKNAFLTIAGTNKDDLATGERSGGFGVAKMAFIFDSDGLYVETVRDGIKTTLDTNSDELLDGKANLKTEPTIEPPGTLIRVRIPKTFKDSSGDDKDIYIGSTYRFFDALKRPLIGNATITYQSGQHGDKEIIPQGRHQDLSKLPKITTAHMPWGDIDVYMGTDRVRFPEHSVLSSGMYQFNSSVSKPGEMYSDLPYPIIMDVHPKVDASDSYYPFNNQREDWSKKIEKDVGQLKAFLKRKFAAEEMNKLGGTFAQSQTMPVTERPYVPGEQVQFEDSGMSHYIPKGQAFEIEPDVEIRDGKTIGYGGVPTDATEFEHEANKLSRKNFTFPVGIIPTDLPLFHNNLNVDIVAEAARRSGISEDDARQFLARIGTIVLDFRNALAKIPAYDVWSKKGQPVGISIDKSYHGVHIRVPFHGFFINPLSVQEESPNGRARSMVHTMIHEAAHTLVSNHGEDFTSALARLEGQFEDKNPGLKFDLEGRVAQTIIEHAAAFQAMKDVFNDNNTKNIEENAGSPQRRDERPGRTEGFLGRPLSIREEQQLAEAVHRGNRSGVSEGKGGRDISGPDEGLAPQYSKIEPPKTAAEAKEAIDNMAADAAGNGGGTGKEAGEMAKGFEPPSKGRPTKHLSGFLGTVERTVMFPRTLAATDWRSAKYWDAWSAKDDEASNLLHEAAEGSKQYIALSTVQRAKLHAVEELDRLKNLTRPDDGYPIVARSDLGISREKFMRLDDRRMGNMLYDAGIERDHIDGIIGRIKDGDQVTIRRALDQINRPLAHSKLGDVIELDPQTTAAYFERRKLFRQRWRDIMRGTAKKFGWDGDPTAEAMRAASENEETEAGRNRLYRLATLMDAMAAQERSGYVPLMRFGDYYLVPKPKPGEDPESLGGFPRALEFRLVDTTPSLVETMKGGTTRRAGELPEAVKKEIEELRKRYPEEHYDIAHGYLASTPDQLRQLDIPAVEKLLTALGQKDSEVFGPMVEELQKKLYEELTAGFKRRASNIPGYSPDFARATGSYMHWTSRHVAEQIHGENVRRAKQQYIDTHPDRGTRQFWTDWEADQMRGASWMRALQQYGFYWELAANPSSSIAIAEHGPIAANFTLGIGLGSSGTGAATAAKYLYPALGQALKAWRTDSKEGLHINIADIRGLTPKERAGLEAADKAGVLHSNVTDELSGMMQGGFDDLTPEGKFRRRVLRVAASNIAVVDRMNRIGIWLAAHRLAHLPGTMKKWNKVWWDNQLYREMVERNGLTPETMARFMVDEGAFVWGKKNQPYMARKLPLTFQFQGFRMRLLSALWRNAHRMGPEGKLSALLMMAAMVGLAGVLGLPGAEDIEGAAEAVWKRITGVDPMIESHLYRLFGNSDFSKRAAEFVLRGAPRSVLGIDLSNRLGFGKIFTGEGPFATGAEALGVVPGIIWNAINQSWNRYENGQKYGAVAPLLPASLRNPYTAAVVYPKEGVRTQYQKRNEPAVVPPNKIDFRDMIAKGLGWQPSPVTRAYEMRAFEQRLAAAAREHPLRPSRSHPKSPEDLVPRRARRSSPYPK